MQTDDVLKLTCVLSNGMFTVVQYMLLSVTVLYFLFFIIPQDYWDILGKLKFEGPYGSPAIINHK